MGYFFLAILICVIIAIAMLLYLNGCSHNWEVIEEGNIIDTYDDVSGKYRICECSHCKKIKIYKVMIN